jgi:hypothetical protein
MHKYEFLYIHAFYALYKEENTSPFQNFNYGSCKEAKNYNQGEVEAVNVYFLYSHSPGST